MPTKPATRRERVAVNPDDQNACTRDSCDPATGVHHVAVNPDDNNVCTTDSCDPATGVHHVAVNPDDHNACTADSCDPVTGVHHAAIPLDDADACTTDSCDPATGVRHVAVNPDDQNACTTDSCDPATGVHHVPLNPDDGDACTRDSCDIVTGVHHVAVSVDDANACTVDTCDPTTGVQHTPVNPDDHNVCTLDACDSATGVSHTVLSVDDGNACTLDACNPVSGVSHDPINPDDHNLCTTDSCDPGTGVHNLPVNVDDANACTVDTCDPATGPRHVAVNTDDQNVCTVDACDSVTGAISHTPLSVDDLNPCTTDACNPVSGITHTPVNVDDGVACTADSCDPLTGIVHTPVNSACDSDGRSCTVAVCNPSTGCSEVANDAACGNTNACPAARCLGATGAAGTGCGTALVDVNCGALQVCRATGCAPETPSDQVGNLVITEFSALDPEMVEIYNPGTSPVDLSGFVLSNLAGATADLRAVGDRDGTLKTPVTLAAKGQLFGVPNPPSGISPRAGAAFVYGPVGTSFALNDSGDVLSLYSRRGATLQDQVDFRQLAVGARVPVGPADFVAAPGFTTQVDPSALSALGNDVPTAWCTPFYPAGTSKHRVRDTAGAANGSCSGAVINEVLAHTSGGDDGRTFVELAGPGGAAVGGMSLEDVVANGSGAGARFADGDFGPGETDGEYTLPAGTRLPPGGYLVVADGVNSGAQGTAGSLVPGLVPGVDLIARDMDLQDGAASLQLLAANGSLLDVVGQDPLGTAFTASVAYNGFVLVEGTPAVGPEPYTSLGRNTASDDRANNRLDWIPSVATPGTENVSVHLWLGKPDASVAEAAQPNAYLSEKRQYTVSYNGSLKNPNWSAWELNASWKGPASRQDTFRTDSTLPSSIPQAALSDYSSSGYDRGHMCPSDDRDFDATDNSATFFLTNMVPQAPNNNQGPWEKLESYARCISLLGTNLYIVSGGLYEGPVVYTKPGTTVRVPSHTWKVMTVMGGLGLGPSDVTTNTRVIAVIMPNNDSLIARTSPWRNYRVTAREVENRTGLNFHRNVPQSIQDVIETRLDTDTTLCGGF